MLTLGKFDHIPHAFPYCLGEEVLDHVFSEKDIGITIDSELIFEEHIMNQIKKANSIGRQSKICRVRVLKVLKNVSVGRY